MDGQTTETISCKVYNGKSFVGILTGFSNGEDTTVFEYSPDYKGPALLSMPKNQGPLTFKGLPSSFSNLLSEGWLEEAQKKVLSATGIHISPASILAYFGGDCVGSIWVEPPKAWPKDVLEALEDIGAILASTNSSMMPGMKPKFLATRAPNGELSISSREEKSTHMGKLLPPSPVEAAALHRGQTMAGFTQKKQDFSDYLLNEFVSTKIVQELLPKDKTSQVELVPFLDTKEKVLLVERFDRDSKGNPIEFYEFNTLFNLAPEQKDCASYGDIADYIRLHATGDQIDGIKTNIADIDVLFKRMMAMILVGSGDSHLKNFALLRQGDEFRLSPNYDIVSERYKTGNALALSITPLNKAKWLHSGEKRPGKLFLANLEPRDVVHMAQSFGLMSKDPTPEEAAKVFALVGEVTAPAKALCGAVKSRDLHEFPNLEKIKNQPGITRELKLITDCIQKRLNGTLDVEKMQRYIDKKKRNMTAPKRPSPTSAAARVKPAIT